MPESQPVGIAVAPRSPAERKDTGCRLYHRVWRRSEIPAAVSVEPATWIIFTDAMGLGKQVVLQLNGAGHRVIEVSPGKAFTRLSNNRYVIRPSSRADYDRLIGDIRKRGNTPQKIMHLWSVCNESRNAIEPMLSLTCYSLSHLGRIIQEQELSPLNIAVISNRLQSVLGEPVHNPVRATVLGVTRHLYEELKEITCRSVDCDPIAQGTAYVAVQLIAEQCSRSNDPVVAYRGEDRWIQGIEPREAHRSGKPKILKERGVYLITGGLGDQGLAIAESLARDCRAQLVLVDRLALPPRGEWTNTLAASSTSEGVKQALRKITLVQSSGGEVLPLCADVGRQEELARVFELAVAQFGKIDGVVHAPSIFESSSLREEPAARVVSDEIQGTLALQELLKKTTVDFFALFASVPSPMATAERADYEAVSAFFQAFVNCGPGVRTLAIHWESAQNEMDGRSGRDAADVLSQVLASDTSNGVIVSSNDLLRHEVMAKSGVAWNNSRTAAKEDVEGVLRNWWLELLSLDEIDLDDDFFELGGHSLIGVSLFSKIKKTYGLDLGLATLFEARTVRELAQLIRRSSKAPEIAGPKPWSPLVPIQPKGKRRPLYVISGLGGNVVKFHSLAVHLGEDQPIFGLLPRGLDGKSSYHTRIEDIATDYVKAIRAKQPNGPYQVVGYSFGGIVAFEVAQQMVAQGEQVSLLGLFDTLEWQYGDKVDESLRPGERIDAIREHVNEILFGQEGGSYLKKLLAGNFFKIKRGILRTLGRPIAQENASIEEINSYAGAVYRPKLYPGKLILFRSEKRSLSDGSDPFLGWGGLADRGVEVHHIPSTHFNMLQEPAISVLAKDLGGCLQS
jgi:thioesterase domain-containing protein/acyl carrier protein/NADP-dependent 3-hydroxy acid dehydrogenase YdfG